MNKIELIKYLHSAYPELTINIDYVEGYSKDEMAKLERLYDIEIQGQLLDFLTHIGRCSGGLFGSAPLTFYQEQTTVRDEILFQFGSRESLMIIQQYDLVKQKPFFISVENDTQFYFLLTTSDNPDSVYRFDENEDLVINTGLTLNEYLRYVVDFSTRNYEIKIPFDQSGDLLSI
ncbi:hypothetical protein ID858_03390 [Xenorhabdus sp. DI]|uniref:hypothetical protein n=1 Tax=Xenorhabdus doucetiae TaxID=351671 RepID=UPI001986596F|nr:MULTISPECIES: hypothetical protein [unclassified Xenorhabdus]MBD2785088.1 hypothetical protein [Xenorhabdus sp. 3]MBD2787551.1 hypothetical protein [Xenorhabdus sp. DI]